MKKIVCMALALVMVFALAATSFAADSKTTLVFGTSADYPPYEFMYPDETGKMVYGGIDVSVAEYIADYLDMELQIENMDFLYLLTALNKGDFDMVLADIEPTDLRLKAVDFSDPYMEELPNMFLVRAEDVDKYQDISDFDGKYVGAQDGSTKVEYVQNDCPGATCVSLALVTDLVNELVNGKIDAVLLDGAVAVNYAQTNPDLAVAPASEFYADAVHYIAVAVAKGDPKGLLPGINAAIAKLTEENKIFEFSLLADSLSGVAEAVTVDAPEGYTPDEETYAGA